MSKKAHHKKEPQPSHPFEIGKQYRNRDGTYHVVSIDEPDMVICYQDGRTVKSSIVLQARIWENMQEDGNSGLELEL